MRLHKTRVYALSLYLSLSQYFHSFGPLAELLEGNWPVMCAAAAPFAAGGGAERHRSFSIIRLDKYDV